MALLRAECRIRNPWIIRRILEIFPTRADKILDVGCGAGFLANELVRHGFMVTGIDTSRQSLAIAQEYDQTGRVQYQWGDANQLPFANQSFDIVCAMDMLEHVKTPDLVVTEIARVLKPDGLFFYHTINRNFLSWLVGIKGVEWFVKNTPPDLHVYRYLIKPTEVRQYCEQSGMQVK